MPPRPSTGHIRVASYNIRKCIGTDRRRRPDRILDVLAEVDADVVALQEADRRFGLRASAIPPELLAQVSSYAPVALDTRPDSLGWHGNAILVRKGAVVEHCLPIHLPMLEPRGAVVAELVLPGGRHLRVIGMHLDLSGLWRKRQVRALVDHVSRCKAKMPTVLMGDMNEWTRRGGCLTELGHDYHVAQTGRSFHSRRPIAELDRIIVDASMQLSASGVHRSLLAQRASDHLPIWADIASTGWETTR